MALGRPTRMDTMRYSYCSTVTIGVFVSLCLIGVWMMTSSTIVTVDMSSTERNAEMRHQVSESNSTPFDDNQGDLPEDLITRDTNNNVKVPRDEFNAEYASKIIDNWPGKSDEDNAAKVDKGMKDTWEDASKSYNDMNGKAGSRESNSDGGQKDTGGEDGQDKAADENSGGELDDNQEKNKQLDSDESANNFVQENTQKSSDDTGNNEQEKNLEQNFDPATTNEQDQQSENGFNQNVENEMQKEVTFDGGVDNGMQKEVTFDGDVENEMQKEVKFNGGVENEMQKEVTFDGSVENEMQKEVTFDGGIAQDENNKDQIKGVGGQSQRNDAEQRYGGNDLQNQKKDQVTFDGDVENEMQKEVTFDGGNAQDENNTDQMKGVAGQSQRNADEQSSGGSDLENQKKDQALNEVFPQSELLNETNAQNGAWSTQAAESNEEKLVQASSYSQGRIFNFTWKLCNSTAGADYIPCLDNEAAIKKLQSTKHYEHRERHCPEEAPTCLVPIPDRYRQSIEWPKSRDKIWYYNVPHTKLADFKGHQNWVKVSGENLIFPGGGTQFKNGALHYIDQIQEALPDISWGKRSRVVLDVGCGVASFGGYLFDRDALTMSFAPKDEHEAQVQFALERGIPATLNVMGTKRLPYPGRVFDVIHCARCRVPWHNEGGKLLLEINRLLRPGGYFVWSATPVYQAIPVDVEIWEAMSALTKSMCWDMVKKTKDTLNGVGIAIYRKPLDNTCYDKRAEKHPPLCQESDDPNAAWNISLQACMHKLPSRPAERGSQWPEQWPLRLGKVPYWLNNSQVGVYGKAAPEDFKTDYEHWKHVVKKSYLNSMGINWAHVRNAMDMRSVYGGFAAALRDMKVWVMNVVTIDSPDTLPIIYERGLFGIYHDWCESFSTYPRSYDLLHADHLFSQLKNRCKLLPVLAEVDRILRPEGKLIVRDKAEIIDEIENIAKSMHWNVLINYSKSRQGLLCIQKTMWRPKEVEATTSL